MASLTQKRIANIVSANTQDVWNNNNEEVNATTEVEAPQKINIQNCEGGLQNQKIVELPIEDSTESFGGLNESVSTSLLKKHRSQMSKVPKALSSSSTKQISNAEKVQIGGTCQRGKELSYQDPEGNEEELKVALEVIRKVMKLDAAEPFNVPVDPVALGIPDYFDIIDTPMDFSTICYNIENGVKYKSSNDVMRDVECIWDNCSKYNKKGHYILELMKRIKKNFMKYWTEAGLYKEQQQEIDEEMTLLPTKPHTTSNINGYKSPMGSLANCARSLHQDREDVTRPYPDQPLLARTESYKSQQKPHHNQHGSAAGHAEAAMKRNPHDSLEDMMDYGFAYPYARRNPHEIPYHRSSLRKSEPYQLQESSCHCQKCHLQMQHSHQHANAGSPHGHRYAGRHHAEKSSCSRQNKIYHQSGYHDHQYPPYYSQYYPPRRELCHCVQCSEQKQLRSFVEVDDDDDGGAAGFSEGEFDSDGSEDWNISSAKQQGPRISKCPNTDFTIQRPQDNIDSSYMHKQQPSKTIFVEEDFATPVSKPLGMVAKHVPGNDTSVPMRENINRDPQMESCQGQSSSQPQISSPQDLLNMFHTGSSKTKKKRGPTRCVKVFETEDKICITTNEDGEAVGPEASKIISFLGVIARNGHVAPISCTKWSAIPEENKEKMWQLIQSKFDIDPYSKFWALRSISRKWTCWKAFLKANHYNPHKTNEARLADCNERVLPEQWAILVEYWNTPEAQAASASNKANAACAKFNHAAGSKSFARLREEQRQKMLDGKEPSEADMFILTRTRKNGQPLTQASSTVISQLRHVAQQQQGTSEPDTIDDEVFVQVMGEDKFKRKHVRTKSLPPEAEKIVSEAKAEVLEMKEKMVAVEQTCAQMAAQMAAMMAMMQKNFADNNNNKSNVDAPVNPQESEHVSASHSGIQAPERPATDNGKKVGKVVR